MNTKIILKNSQIQGKEPTISDLDLGEIAINTYDSNLYLKQDQDGELSIVRFTKDTPIEGVIFVQKNGNDTNRGDSWDSAYLTIERAIEDAWTRDGAVVLIEIGPGIYTTRGHIDMPDNSIIHCVYRSVKIRPEIGYEERNVFRMGSGCFIEGPLFEGFRVDRFDDPTEGFAAVFRPGASIMRTPYVHKIAVRSIPTWTTVAPPLDRENSNPLVPRGGGVVMADGNVISPYSIYPNIMTWGATPVIHNGIGYVAKNGALINAVNAISIWAHKHFYAYNGGQIILSACSTQFGDYTLVSEGVRNTISPYSLEQTITANTTAGNLVYAAANTILDGMISYLDTEGFTSTWPSTYIDNTKSDGNLLFRSLSWTLESGNEKPVLDFTKGFFDPQGDRVFIPSEYDYEKAFRDTGYITDAVAYDLAFGSNFRSITSALAYYRSSAATVLTDYLPETIASLERQKSSFGNYLTGDNLVESNALFDEIINIVTNGPESANTFIIPDPTSYDTGFENARRLLIDNKEFIKTEVDSWIKYQIDNDIAPFSSNTVFEYDQELCSRDIGLIIDSLGYDMMFGSDFRAITAGRAYYRNGAAVVIEKQKAVTVSTYKYLKTILSNSLIDNTAKSRIEAGMDIIISILDNGLSSVPTTYSLPLPTGGNNNASDSGYLNARNLINLNRDFIKAEIIGFLEAKYPSIEYDRVKCSRDVDYIIDAIIFDMTYGGNLETIVAANAYYSGTVLQLGTAEKAPTIEAYLYLAEMLQNISVNFIMLPYQDVIAQIQGTAGSLAAATKASLLATIITETLRTNTAQAIEIPDLSWVSPSLVSENGVLQTYKISTQSNIIAYIDAYFGKLVYDRDLCKRDIGLILDAVGYDAMFSSNFRTVTAARAYRRAGSYTVINGQRAVTISALEFLKNEIYNIVNAISTSVADNIVTNMNLIINTLTNDAYILPYDIIDYTFGIPTGGINNIYTSDYNLTRNTVESERTNIKSSVITFIETNYPEVANTYSQSTCERDIDYILNAVYYDLTYGGNLETAVAANAYYSNAVLQLGAGEKAASIAAYQFMRDELITIVTSAVNATMASVVASLIQSIIDTIDTTIPPVIVAPDTSWVPVLALSSHNSLQTNKITIQSSVINYVDTEFVYGYDIEKCKRDIGFIIDAIRYDMTYGGNLETYNAATAYFSGTNPLYGSGEKIATISALNHMNDILGYVLQANSAPISVGNTEAQDMTLPAGSLQATIFAQSRLSEIISTITNDGKAPLKILPATDWISLDKLNAFTLINTNKSTISIDVMEYLAKNEKNLLGAFLSGYDYIEIEIKNILGVGSYESEIVSLIIRNIKNTLMNPKIVEEPSLISAIGHTWTAIMSGVALTKMPPATNKASIQDSIVELDKGIVTASGQDDQGSALFVGGLVIDADTGELSGPPFQQAVNRISTRAAISRSF